MKKNILITILIILTLIFKINFVKAEEVFDYEKGYLDYLEQTTKSSEFPDLKSKNVLLYNLDNNTILYQKNINDKISIASLTKIMTTLTIIENTNNLEDKVKITNEAFNDISEYTTAGFKIGDKVTYWDLLYGIMLPSGADAAQAGAIAVAGNIKEFAKLMNEEAKKIGMTNSSFSNPVGKDESANYSTVNDLSKMLLYALNNKDFYKIYTTKEYTTTNNIKVTSTLKQAGDRYNFDTSSILGSKSGYTDAAGLCLTSIAKYNNINYMLITTNAQYAYGYPNHIEDTINIYNYYSNNYEYQKIINKNQDLVTLDIIDGFDKKYTITSDKDISLYLDKKINTNKLDYKYEGIKKLNYKTKLNTKLGTVKVSYEDNVIYTYDIFLKEKIKYKHTKLVISILFIIIIFLLLKIKIKKNKRRRRKKYAKKHNK